MPWQNGAQARWVARGDGRAEHCVCIPGWYGANCETGPGDYNPRKETDEKDGRGLAVKRHCVHGCSGRGVCRLNWCHCVPGTYGTDCSLGTPDGPRAALVASLAASLEAAASKDGGAADRARASSLVGQLAALDPPAARNAKPALAAAAGGAPLRHWAYNGKVGWSPAMVSKAAPPLPAADRSLRVYVYDLPPKFNTWLAAHFRRPGRWDQSYLYSLDAKLHRWLPPLAASAPSIRRRPTTFLCPRTSTSASTTMSSASTGSRRAATPFATRCSGTSSGRGRSTMRRAAPTTSS